MKIINPLALTVSVTLYDAHHHILLKDSQRTVIGGEPGPLTCKQL